nr:nucleolar protein 4-like [Biomphalaria glabrata]
MKLLFYASYDIVTIKHDISDFTIQVRTEGDAANSSFKKVAVVENFFDIIYNVHVEMDGRGGKHAGQKRTYRAIAETYSFLPREAVTRFLMACTDCQKRMHLSLESNNNLSSSEDRNDFMLQVTLELDMHFILNTQVASSPRFSD